jgi:hypothetical protein
MANCLQTNYWGVSATPPPPGTFQASTRWDMGRLLASLGLPWSVWLSLSGRLSLGAAAEELAKVPPPGVVLRGDFLFSFSFFLKRTRMPSSPRRTRILWASAEGSALPHTHPLLVLSLPRPASRSYHLSLAWKMPHCVAFSGRFWLHSLKFKSWVQAHSLPWGAPTPTPQRPLSSEALPGPSPRVCPGGFRDESKLASSPCEPGRAQFTAFEMSCKQLMNPWETGEFNFSLSCD